ncbi:MAG: recombinase RecA [Anaerolineae bacterium]|nr:recombinase RecA [Anaerolineae bacterium]
MADPDRDKALETTLATLKRRFGDGAIMKLGGERQLNVEAISTGSIGLDLALGIGGVPRGRVTEIYGPESSGKTTLCQHIIAEAQKQGGVAAFVDVEHAFDPSYAEKCGVDINNLLVSQPDNGEQALEITEALVRSGAVDVIVVDSVAALVPRAEIEGEMGDSHPGLQARLMSQALRKLASAISRSNVCVIFTNQIRQKIGVMFGNPETTAGGMALRFYASVRLEIRRTETIKSGGEEVGNRAKVTVKKNKVAPPFRKAEFDIMFNHGISREGDLLDVGKEMGIVEQRGAFYLYGDQRLGQGRENAKTFLSENPNLTLDIENAIRARQGLAPKPASAPAPSLSAPNPVPVSETPAKKGKRAPGKAAPAAAAVADDEEPASNGLADIEARALASQYAQATLMASDEDAE